EEAMPSPGMLTRHYAPRTPVEILGADWRGRVGALARGGRQGIVVARRGDEPGLLVPRGPGGFPLPGDPRRSAAELDSTLHAGDRIGYARILVLLPPDAEEWLAVRDRLRRAAAPG